MFVNTDLVWKNLERIQLGVISTETETAYQWNILGEHWDQTDALVLVDILRENLC